MGCLTTYVLITLCNHEKDSLQSQTENISSMTHADVKECYSSTIKPALQFGKWQSGAFPWPGTADQKLFKEWVSEIMLI